MIRLDVKSQFSPKLIQPFHISFGLMAKMKVETFMNFAGAQAAERMFCANSRGGISERSRPNGSTSTASHSRFRQQAQLIRRGVKSFDPDYPWP